MYHFSFFLSIRLVSEVIQGWWNLVEVCLVGIWSEIMFRIFPLKHSHILSMSLEALNLVIKRLLKFEAFFLIKSVSNLFQSRIVRCIGFFLLTWRRVWTVTKSWSPIPELIELFSMRFLWLVRKRSNIEFPRVGDLMVWLRPKSKTSFVERFIYCF